MNAGVQNDLAGACEGITGDLDEFGSGVDVGGADFNGYEDPDKGAHTSAFDAEMYGAEVELTLSPAEGWDLLFGVSLLDAEVKDVPMPDFVTIKER